MPRPRGPCVRSRLGLLKSVTDEGVGKLDGAARLDGYHTEALLRVGDDLYLFATPDDDAIRSQGRVVQRLRIRGWTRGRGRRGLRGHGQLGGRSRFHR